MKLIIAILRNQDTETVVQALITKGYRVTRIASTGGFIKRGSSTIMVGVDESQIDGAFQVIRSNLSPIENLAGSRATLFVLDVANFSQV
jgi:uncharacterized protein YaaQ